MRRIALNFSPVVAPLTVVSVPYLLMSTWGWLENDTDVFFAGRVEKFVCALSVLTSVLMYSLASYTSMRIHEVCPKRRLKRLVPSPSFFSGFLREEGVGQMTKGLKLQQYIEKLGWQ